MITAVDTFTEKTALAIDILIDQAIQDTPHNLNNRQLAWFREHCNTRFRWFHANKPDWQKWLENRNKRIDPRGQCIVWIRHWFTSYRLDPARFQQQYAMCPGCGGPEYYECRSDGFVWMECDDCGHKITLESPSDSA